MTWAQGSQCLHIEVIVEVSPNLCAAHWGSEGAGVFSGSQMITIVVTIRGVCVCLSVLKDLQA